MDSRVVIALVYRVEVEILIEQVLGVALGIIRHCVG